MTSTPSKSTRQTLLILLPELLILLTATVMMTAGAFVRLPRRVWCASAVGGACWRPCSSCYAVREPAGRPVLGGRPERRVLVLRPAGASC